jgi:hypothetical protein
MNNITKNDLIEMFEDAHYDACIELNITTNDMFKNRKDEIYDEAEDDLRTEPLWMNGFNFDTIIYLARKRITFDGYINYINDNP